MKHAPLPIEELKKQRLPIKNINVEHFEKLTSLEKAALFIAEKVGTLGFFFHTSNLDGNLAYLEYFNA